MTVTGAGLNDGTSEANAWSFAQMIAAAPSGTTRVNIKSGTYSVGAYTVGSGTAAGLFVLRGYNTTIGDLDTPSYNSDGSLNVTNFPSITITSIWTPGTFSLIQNLDITGALSSALIGSTTVDVWYTQNVKITNTQNNASARCLQGDNSVHLINSDFSCTGASHAALVDVDLDCRFDYCRFKSTSSSGHITCEGSSISGCVFWGNSSSVAVSFQTANSAAAAMVSECTFSNIGTAVQFPNAVNGLAPIVVNNYATGCSKFIESLYSSTANYAVIVGNNRTRNITTMYTGIEEIEFGGVTTAGSDATDYVNAGAGDFNLLSTAPGVSVAMRQYRSMGALQRDQTGGGGSGGGLRLAGHGGLAS